MKINTRINPKTPKKINGSVRFLVRSLGLKTTPIYFSLTQIPNTRAGYCFNNCEDYIKENGGDAIYGWMIWEDRKKGFIEAEFHVVIKKENQYLDITPRYNYEDKILFVEDNTRKSGRMDDESWYSWSNIKIVDNYVSEMAEALKIKELNHENSEVIPLYTKEKA
ncbi:hypothetical protein [Xenorhabdus bovienii]|uniref:Uncharacterized protein n=1 Tax=Xenorhabdus bovienii str. feltiae Moldova TaxID=1398200 RepID=A0A077NZN3_XENBV|nr:hypothetical protein [Xenorhabdus bovienii]CDH03899.1 hypothetical protein XBFM1_890001 [Xenorhabdus bovienii str. feltiae Moldova]